MKKIPKEEHLEEAKKGLQSVEANLDNITEAVKEAYVIPSYLAQAGNRELAMRGIDLVKALEAGDESGAREIVAELLREVEAFKVEVVEKKFVKMHNAAREKGTSEFEFNKMWGNQLETFGVGNWAERLANSSEECEYRSISEYPYHSAYPIGDSNYMVVPSLECKSINGFAYMVLKFKEVFGIEGYDKEKGGYDEFTVEKAAVFHKKDDDTWEFKTPGKITLGGVVVATKPTGFGYKCGKAETRGIRSSMEDVTCMLPQPYGLFAGVYDGHGGSEAANFAARKGWGVFDWYLSEMKGNESPVSEAFKASYERLDNAIKGNLDENGEPDDIADDSIKGTTASTTAANIFFDGNTLYCANAGDTRIVLVKKEGEEELSRGRKLGDDGVISNPHTREFKITDDVVGVIIASNGLWDVVSDEEAAEYMKGHVETGLGPEAVAGSLKNFAISEGTTDNVSIVVVMFYPESVLQAAAGREVAAAGAGEGVPTTADKDLHEQYMARIIELEKELERGCEISSILCGLSRRLKGELSGRVKEVYEGSSRREVSYEQLYLDLVREIISNYGGPHMGLRVISNCVRDMERVKDNELREEDGKGKYSKRTFVSNDVEIFIYHSYSSNRITKYIMGAEQMLSKYVIPLLKRYEGIQFGVKTPEEEKKAMSSVVDDLWRHFKIEKLFDQLVTSVKTARKIFTEALGIYGLKPAEMELFKPAPEGSVEAKKLAMPYTFFGIVHSRFGDSAVARILYEEGVRNKDKGAIVQFEKWGVSDNEGVIVKSEVTVFGSVHMTMNEDALAAETAAKPEAVENLKFKHLSGLKEEQIKNIRTLIVPDVHGQLDRLMEILQESGFVDTDGNWIPGDRHLIFLGDLIDRGKQSKETYEYVLGLQKQAGKDQAGKYQVEVLLGNHELSFVGGAHLSYGRDPQSIAMLVHDIEIGNAIAPQIKKDILEGQLVAATSVWCDEIEYIVVHAGVVPKLSRDRQIQTLVDEFNKIVVDNVKEGIDYDNGGFSTEIFWAAGRKGSDDYSGIFWADFKKDLTPVADKAIPQIVGHTADTKNHLIRQKGNVICVDVGMCDYYGGGKDALAIVAVKGVNCPECGEFAESRFCKKCGTDVSRVSIATAEVGAAAGAGEASQEAAQPIREVTVKDFQVKIHPAESDVIVLNYPGSGGSIDGYNKKYSKIADLIVKNGIGAVVRMSNEDHSDYPNSMINNFKRLIEYALEHSEEICGSESPTLYLMGFSAGASVIAAVCSDYPQVKKILLLAPSGDAGRDVIQAGLSGFEGEVYIAIGAEDDEVGSDAGQKFYDVATAAKKRKLEIIPNCDHQFRGETNGMILSKAPLWAFAGDETFPSPDDGKRLYGDPGDPNREVTVKELTPAALEFVQRYNSARRDKANPDTMLRSYKSFVGEMPVSQEIFLSRYEQIMKSFGLKMGEKYLEKLRDGKAKPEFASSHNFDDFFGFPLNEKEYIALPNFKVVLDGSIPTKLKIHSVFEVKTEGGNYGVSSPAKFKVSGDDWALVTPGTITAIDDVSPGLFHEAKLAEDLIKEHISRLYGFIRSPADEPEVNLKEAIPIAEEMLGLIKGLKPGDFNLMDRARRLVEYYLDSNDVGMAEIVLMEIEKRIDERLVYKE